MPRRRRHIFSNIGWWILFLCASTSSEIDGSVASTSKRKKTSADLQYASRTFNWTLNVSYGGIWQGRRILFPVRHDLRHTFSQLLVDTNILPPDDDVSRGSQKGGTSFLYPSYVRPGKGSRHILEAHLVSSVLLTTRRPRLLDIVDEGEGIDRNRRRDIRVDDADDLEEEDVRRFQVYLRRVQRPFDCEDRPMMVLTDFQSHIAQMGFGSQLNILIETFWLALAEKRVFTFAGGSARTTYVDSKRCPSTLFTCLFESPTNCSAVRWKRPGPLPERVVYAFGGCTRQKYHSQLLKSIARDANLRSNSYDLVWYFVQLTRYVFFDADGGLNAPTRERVRAQLARTPLFSQRRRADAKDDDASTSIFSSSPCVAVHIRRGDAFTDGRRLHETAAYVSETKALLRRRPDIRSVFLTSDAPVSFYDAFRRAVTRREHDEDANLSDVDVWWLSPDLFRPRGRERASSSIKYAPFSNATNTDVSSAAPDEATALLLTLDVMSRCSYIVGALSSQFGKMANALALARQGKAFGGFVDLDGGVLGVCGG